MNSFKELIEQAALSSVAKKPFIISERSTFSYEQLVKRVKGICALLDSKGIKSGDKVLVSLTDDFDMVCTTIAIISFGATAVLMEPCTKERRAGVIVSASKIDGWIVDAGLEKQWNLPTSKFELSIEKPTKSKGVLNKLLQKKQDSGDRTLDHFLNGLGSGVDLGDVQSNQPAVVIFTSGSTADPKGVVLTHGNILAHLKTLSRQHEIESNSIISNILPLYHVDGLFQGALLAFYNQIPLSRPFAFEIQRIDDLLHSVYKYRVTHFITVPTILMFINQYGQEWKDSFETDDFKYVISSAGYLDETLWQSFMDNFNVRILNVYGLTESVTGGLFCGPKPETWRLGSVGKPSDCETMIVDEVGNPLGQDQVGELLLRGENILLNYLNPIGNPDDDGWFHTGDMAYVDADGFYYIKGRLKNIIIRGGINVYPEEIIEILNQHEGIEESFVYGEADDVWGEHVIAAITRREFSEITDQDIIQYCKQHLEPNTVPDKVYFVEEIPRGLSGKVKSEEIKALVEKQKDQNAASHLINDSLENEVLQLATTCFNSQVTREQLNSPSQSIQGWNSLEHLQFVTLIENTYNVKFTTKDIMNVTTISKAINLVSDKLK